jgi:hypothetical protein
MKIFFALLVVTVGGFFGYRHLAEKRAETALKESLCAQELNAEILAALEGTADSYNNRDALQGVAHGLKTSKMMHESSLEPHLPALTRMAEGSGLLERIHRIARELHAQCPDVFPDEKTGQKVVAATIMLGTALE